MPTFKMSKQILFLVCLFLASVILLWLPHPLKASVGRSGADFLQLPAGARANAMGGAFVAISDDAYAPYWNPAGMNQLSRTSLGFSHQEELFKVQNDLFSYVQPVEINKTIGFAGQLHHIESERRSVSGEKLGTFTNYGLSMGGYYASQLGEWDGGIGMKLIRQKLAGKQGTSIALDGGLLNEYTLAGFPLRVGASVRNFGNDMTIVNEADPLPITVRGGLATDIRFRTGDLKPDPEGSSRLTVASDISRLTTEKLTEYSLGLEYGYENFLFLRGGLNGASGEDLNSNLSLGFGVLHRDVRVDYSWSESELLGSKHLITLNMEFNGPREQYWNPNVTYWEQEWGTKIPAWLREWAKDHKRWKDEWDRSSPPWYEDWKEKYLDWRKAWDAPEPSDPIDEGAPVPEPMLGGSGREI